MCWAAAVVTQIGSVRAQLVVRLVCGRISQATVLPAEDLMNRTVEFYLKIVEDALAKLIKQLKVSQCCLRLCCAWC